MHPTPGDIVTTRLPFISLPAKLPARVHIFGYTKLLVLLVLVLVLVLALVLALVLVLLTLLQVWDRHTPHG